MKELVVEAKEVVKEPARAVLKTSHGSESNCERAILWCNKAWVALRKSNYP